MNKVKISYNGETKAVPTVSKTYSDMIRFLKSWGFKSLRNVENIKFYY